MYWAQALSLPFAPLCDAPFQNFDPPFQGQLQLLCDCARPAVSMRHDWTKYCAAHAPKDALSSPLQSACKLRRFSVLQSTMCESASHPCYPFLALVLGWRKHCALCIQGDLDAKDDQRGAYLELALSY